jgi:hypothetical protein
MRLVDTSAWVEWLVASPIAPAVAGETADAIVYATALARGADLLTCNKHLDGLPGVRYLPKDRR